MSEAEVSLITMLCFGVILILGSGFSLAYAMSFYVPQKRWFFIAVLTTVIICLVCICIIAIKIKQFLI